MPLFVPILTNYVTNAVRHLRTHLGHTAVSLLSLTVGLGVSLLVGLWIQHQLGWTPPAEASGQTITLNDVESEIVGVVADFHHRAFSTPIEPMALQYDPSQFGYLTARLDGPVTTERVEALREVWGQFFGDRPMPHSSLADHFASQYQDQRRLQRAFGWGTLLALLLAGLGLFGLSAFMVARRTGEIGIR